MVYNRSNDIYHNKAEHKKTENNKEYDFNVVHELTYTGKPCLIGRFIVKAHESLRFLGGMRLLRMLEKLSFINGDRNKLIIFFDGTCSVFIFIAFIARVIESMLINPGLQSFVDGWLGK